jgi:hypothetical protein
VVVLPCEPAIATPYLRTHQLGEHLGARDDRHLAPARLGHFRVVGLDRGGDDHDIGGADVLRAVAAGHDAAQAAQPLHDRSLLEVGSGDAVPHVDQHLGDAAHAAAADADEMDPARLAQHHHDASSPTRSTMRAAASGRQARRRVFHRREPRRRVHQLRDGGGETGAGEAGLGHQEGGPRRREPSALRVWWSWAAVGGHQDRAPRRRQLRHRAGAGARDDADRRPRTPRGWR